MATETYLEILNRYAGHDPRMVRLTSAETSALTRFAPKTLEAKRANGTGPKFLKIGRNVAYRLSDVLDFIEGSVYSTTREAKTSRRAARAA